MLAPLLAATDGFDPLRPDADDADEPGATPQQDPPPSPTEDPEPVEPEPVEPEPVDPEPVRSDAHAPVALVPSAGEPRPDAPPPDSASVQEAMRGADAPAADVAPATEKRSPVQRFALAALLIAAAALIGYAVSRPAAPDADPDTLARSAEAARTLQFVLDTDDAREARRFVRNEFGWRVGVPIFSGAGAASLRGLAVAEVAPAVEVPVFLYSNGDNREVAVFVYSYALLDQVPDRLTFSRGDLDMLAEGDPVVRRADDTELVLWRDRDDIYVAVTDLPAPRLIESLTMAR